MSNKSKGFIIFLLLLIVGALCYYIVINKDRYRVETPVVENKITKEYREKDYVFDTSYSTENIVFPYLNLDYSNVHNINYQIKYLFETNIGKISSASYEYFINDDILSVVIKANINNIDNYYTYNVNMENGKELLFEEVNYKYGQQDLALKNKISEYIENNEEIKKYLDEIVLTKDYITDTSYNNYKLNALSNNVKFYLNNSNHVNVIIKIDLNEVYYEYAVFEI